MATEKSLIAHLYRRAGFGTTPAMLEKLSKKDYDSIVDDLVDMKNLKNYLMKMCYQDIIPN